MKWEGGRRRFHCFLCDRVDGNMEKQRDNKDGRTDRGKKEEEEDEGGEEGERDVAAARRRTTTREDKGRETTACGRRSLTDTHRSHSGRFDIGRRTSQPTCSAAVTGGTEGGGGRG